MARQVFFSFHYDRDHWRASIVRNSQVISGYDKSPFYEGRIGADQEEGRHRYPQLDR